MKKQRVRCLDRSGLQPTHFSGSNSHRWQVPGTRCEYSSHASLSSSNKAAETMKRIVRLLYHLLCDMIKKVPIKAAIIVVSLCHCWVHTCSVDPSANHAADIVHHFGLNIWQTRTKIHVETLKYIQAWIIHRVISVHLLHLLCAPPPGRHSGGTPNSAVFQANRRWWMVVEVRAMNVGVISSIKDLSFIPMCRMPWKYVRWIISTISVAANRNLHSYIDHQDNN